MTEKKISQAAVSRVENGIESMLRSLAVTRPEDIKENFAEILRSISEKAVESVVAEGAKIVIPRSEDDATSFLGEGIHVGLRKGSSAPEAHDLWTAISASGRAWSDGLGFMFYGATSVGVVVLSDEEA